MKTMENLKKLLSEGEAVFEMVRCAAAPVYFIGLQSDDIDKMDISGCIEDTLHRMLDAEFTEEDIADVMCAYQDSDAMDDDDCYYIDLDYVIYDFYPMSIIDTGIHYEEPKHIYTVHFFDTVICKHFVVKENFTDEELLDALHKAFGINPDEYIVVDSRGDESLVGIQNVNDNGNLLMMHIDSASETRLYQTSNGDSDPRAKFTNKDFRQSDDAMTGDFPFFVNNENTDQEHKMKTA